FLKAEPGAILANDRLVNLVRKWPAVTEKKVKGIHFVQEDSPDEIGKAIVDFDGNVGLTRHAGPRWHDYPGAADRMSLSPQRLRVSWIAASGSVPTATPNTGKIGTRWLGASVACQLRLF